MQDEEDCNCGLDEPKPEIACQLELVDAVNLYNEFKTKQGMFEDLKGKAKRSTNGKRKKDLAIQGIQIQREIKVLEEGMDLAFQRFAKCESHNPQVQNLNVDAAAEKITNLWNVVLGNNTQTADAKQSSQKKRKKKRKKKKK